MIQKNNFLVYPEEDKSEYPFEICPCCPLRKQCEVVGSHIVRQVQKKQSPIPPVVAVNLLHTEKDKVYPATATPATKGRHSIDEDSIVTEPPLYIRDIWENGRCPMGMFDLVECGNKWVADGIGDDFKISIEYDYSTGQTKIEKSSNKRHFNTYKWEPRQNKNQQ